VSIDTGVVSIDKAIHKRISCMLTQMEVDTEDEEEEETKDEVEEEAIIKPIKNRPRRRKKRVT